MSSNREKEIEETANFIINNISLATSINLLIQKARDTAEIIVDNDYEKENFEIYLNKSKDNLIPMDQTRGDKKTGFFKRLKNKLANIFPSLKEKRSGFSTKRDR